MKFKKPENGKGSGDRVADLKKFAKNYDQIDWGKSKDKSQENLEEGKS